MSSNSTLKWIIVLFLGTFLAACGGGSGSGSADNGSTGTVAVMLTDGPTSDFDQINVTVTGIELIGRNGTRAQVFSGERTIDLLNLQDQADLFGVADVPAGVYTRIRLTVSDVELVKLDPTSGAVVDTVKPKLPGGNRIDLDPRSPFIVNGGDSLVVQLDVDADKSIRVTEAGRSGLTILRPVVFVDIVDGAVSARIAQLHGTVSDIDADAQTFRLCGTPVDFQWFRRPGGTRCLTVQAGASSAFFAAHGTAGGFAGLTDGGPATVIGHVQHTTDGVELAARVVYLGDDANLVRVRGTTSSAVDSGQFGLTVTRNDGGFASGTALEVGLPTGAAIFARSGLELTAADIKQNLDARVLGLKNGTQGVTALAVVLADTSALTETVISGTVGTVSASSFTLLPSSGGSISADTTVCTTANTRIYQISGASSTAIPLSGLTSGWTANVYGRQPLGACFAAGTVIVFQPDSTGAS